MSATQTSTIVRHSSKTSFAALLTTAALCSALIAAPAHAQRSFSRSGQHGSVNASSSAKGNTINGQASVNGSRG
ncbi:MAG: hypothetical protein K2X63_07800, partial [Burkholderiaceae bacterium]|nr:hypothetical protein [Burkholderiaceae bacterium]